MNLRGEPLRIGDRIHAAERDVTAETIDFYCDTFEDRTPAYRGEEAVAPPLLFHSEVYEHTSRWYLKNLVGNLHVRQEWFLFAPLRPKMRIGTRSTLVDRYLRKDRDYLVNEVDYVDESGRLLLRGRTHQSFLVEAAVAEDNVVTRGTAKKKERRPLGEGPGAELESVALTVDRETCWRFSGPAANYHTDEDAARKLGFPGIVVQGLLSTCLMSQVMGNAFGQGWFAGGRMDVKLVNVLWADETIRARAKLREVRPEGTRRRQVVDLWVEKDDEAHTVVTVGEASALI